LHVGGPNQAKNLSKSLHLHGLASDSLKVAKNHKKAIFFFFFPNSKAKKVSSGAT
jgi:hypothetical protein